MSKISMRHIKKELAFLVLSLGMKVDKSENQKSR
jgi:hypothetical protein